MKLLRRRVPLRAMMVLSALVLPALVPAVAGAAEPSALTWSSDGSVDSAAAGGNTSATALSCPTQTQCTLLDFSGNVVTFDPKSVTAAPAPVSIGAGGRSPGALSCPATNLCVAADNSGGVVTFDPGSPSSSAHQVQLNANGNPLTISCPTSSECVAAETVSAGNPGEITFNPASPPTNRTPVSIDPGGQGLSVSCPAGLSNLCVAVDQVGKEVAFNPGSPSGATRGVVSSHDFLVSVACPPYVTDECTGIDANGNFVTFNPAKPSAAITYEVAVPNHWYGGSFDCPTRNVCTAVDTQGHAATFDPTITSSAAANLALVPSGAGSGVATSCPIDPSNPAQIECVAVDYMGDAVLGTGTIAPPKPSCSVSPQSNTVFLPPVNGQPVEGNEGELFFNVACRTTAGAAMNVNLTGHLTERNGQQTSTLALTKVTGSIQPPSALVLTAKLPYAAVVGLEHGAQESVAISLTGSGVSGSATASTQIAELRGVPAQAQPAQLVWKAELGFDANGATVAVSCPSTTQCTLLDAAGGGDELTFNPLSSGAPPSSVPIGANWAIACPSTTECVTTDGSGNEITFNPNNPPSVPTPVPMDSIHGTPLNVSCPTTTLCAAVETSSPSGAIGGGGEITFNPASPPSNATPTTISSNQGPLWVNCPTGVSDLCVAVDGSQNEITFNPSSPSQSRPSAMVQNDTLFAVACPPGATTQCTTMGGGPAYTFNPNAPARLLTLPTADTNGWNAVACPTKVLCTAVDSFGHALTFDPVINPAPTFQGADIDGQEALVGVSCPNNPSNPAQFECVAVDDIGNVFVGIPKAPPLPKPACALRPKTDQVLLPAKNSQPPTGQEGKLSFQAKCSPTAAVSLTGKLTEVLTTAGKKKTSTFTLSKVTGTARAGATLPLTVTLPRAAVTGLEKNAQESVTMTLAATDASGSATAAARIAKLLGKRQ